MHPLNRLKQHGVISYFFDYWKQAITTHVHEDFPTMLRSWPRAVGPGGQQLARARFPVQACRATGRCPVALGHAASSSAVKAATNYIRF